ncbi:hypothetical protein QQF64_010940 [Cirrhinus molitorella]|uniref:Uncharacterized protein n=1 Tax=Cirrhinus molitorella TaxID=172907 RepID=A0ABR3M094_9TELE
MLYVSPAVSLLQAAALNSDSGTGSEVSSRVAAAPEGDGCARGGALPPRSKVGTTARPVGRVGSLHGTPQHRAPLGSERLAPQDGAASRQDLSLSPLGITPEDFLVETQKTLLSRISDLCAANATAAKGTALRPASPDPADSAETTFPLPTQTSD